MKDIEFAYNEIKDAFDKGLITDPSRDIYNNYKHLFGSKEMREKVFIQGL